MLMKQALARTMLRAVRAFAAVSLPQPRLNELATSAMTAARSMPPRTGMRTTICSLLQRTAGGRPLDRTHYFRYTSAAPAAGW